MYPRLGAEEASTKEMPMGADIKDPNKLLLSLAKGPGKVQPSKTENLGSNQPTLAKQHRKNWGPTLPKGLDSHSYETVLGHPPNSLGWNQRRPNKELGL